MSAIFVIWAGCIRDIWNVIRSVKLIVQNQNNQNDESIPILKFIKYIPNAEMSRNDAIIGRGYVFMLQPHDLSCIIFERPI